MRNLSLISIVEMLILSTSLASAQVSTFPSPPPLAPPPDRGSVQNITVMPPMPDHTADQSALGNPTSPAPAAAGNSSIKPQTPTASMISSMEALDDKVALEAGDSISLRIIEDRDPVVTGLVTDTGEIEFPYLGRLKVEGKTCHQVAIEAKKRLEVDYYNHATVIIGLDQIVGQDRTKPHDLVWVVGEVVQTGPQTLLKNQPTTVSQAIIRAGGFGKYADERKVRIIHRSAATESKGPNDVPDFHNLKDFQIIDVKSVIDGLSTVDPVLLPSDYVVVPKRIFNY